MKLAHEDNRRRLYEWPIAKRLVIKTDCVIGGHYHREKTELFVLVSGAAVIQTRDETGAHDTQPMTIGAEHTVSPGIWHEFTLRAGSILLCLASKPHDPTDDHQYVN